MEQIRQLLTACEEGSAGFVQAVLEQGIDVDVTDDDDTSLLQVAAANGHEHLVRLLLMRGAALDKPNSFGWTPLLLASRHGHVSVVALLLQNNADINARTKLGANALALSARGGHLQTTRLLLEAGIDLSPYTGVGGPMCELSPLIAAAHHGHDTVVRYLLDRGSDVNFRTPSTGINALMLAGLNGHMTTAQILIEHGADPNLTNVNDQTPLQIATVRGKREVTGYLDRKTTNKPQQATEDVKLDIIEAARKGDLTTIRDILEDNITQRDASSPQDGATPLMFASMTGRLDVAQVLVEKGCEINKQDTVSGWTALMQATYHGRKLVAKFLINAGADVLIPAKNGCTAFDMASLIEDVDTELYRLMAAKAVQINRSDRRGKSWSPKQNGTAVPLSSTLGSSSEQSSEEQPKTGLKAWWNRMSNRFRNLKLGRTFSHNNNRLAPMIPVPPLATCDALQGEPPANDATLKSNSSPKSTTHAPKRRQSEDALTSTSVSSVMNKLSATATSYDTIMLETKKSASMYTLGINQPTASLQDGMLCPVIPPFLPLPTFESDRTRMPPSTARKSVAAMGSASTLTSTRPIIPPMKLLQSFSTSTQNLSTSQGSPSASAKFHHSSNSASPSSSAGASRLSAVTSGGKSKGPSSASSSTLTAGSDNINRLVADSQSEPLFTPVSRPAASRPHSVAGGSHSYHRSAAFMKLISSHASPCSSVTSGGSSLPRDKRHSRGKSGSSKDSASTLTPSPSPTPKVAESVQSSHSSTSQPKSEALPEVDELGGILKDLSLEGYQPIFEEQEVDMEAFLTLTDTDLKELGISHAEPRRQILSAILELSSGKGRERQHFQETMSQYHSTLRSRGEFEEGLDYSQWSLQEEDPSSPPETSSKSRAS